MLTGHPHSSQFIVWWQNLDITKLKHVTSAPNVFLKLPENQLTANFIYVTFSNFVTTSHTNYLNQVNSWKNLWKFWNGPLCRYKSGPFPLLNVAVYWKSSDTEACAKELSQILANNIDNENRVIGLRICLGYCRLLNIPGFWICQGLEYAMVLNKPGFEICPDYDHSIFRNTSGFSIWQSSLQIPIDSH